ncbi:CHAT domain-containing protein [Scytonema sp. NUACC26]|uniref:two-partner secretion domain-containing protein n=1 Tax=Scytonema sp. NUACC26 TaxID=3140176 RepID=UPI0034DBD803
MSEWHLKTWILMGSAVWGLSCHQPLAAQVIPDDTLPTSERSLVTGNVNYQIDGGARRGSNLFHSFSQFSVPPFGSAYFNNADDVENIFTRVTGGTISKIDGVIRANARANLFLLNPNGIIFGAGARLNIGGSFVASSANSINFTDNFYYSATNPQTAPLLTVSVPVGLQMGANPGQIAVQGNGYNLSGTTPVITPLVRGNALTGLQVPPGQTLALIGGDIDIQGGVLTAEQGRIELGSVRDGIVNLGAGFALGYPGIQTFGDIHLKRQALADASGSPGGSIQVQGNRVSLLHGSLLLIQNQGGQAAGSLRVNAADSLELSGISPSGQLRGGLNTETIGSGLGGNIAVSTRQLVVRDGTGNGGNIKIHTSSLIAVEGENSDIRANSVNARGGNVTINARGIFGIQFRPQDTPSSDITATGANSTLSGTVQLNIQRLDPSSGLVALPTTVIDSSSLIATGCTASEGNSFVTTGRGGLPLTPEQELDDDADWQDRRRLTVDRPPQNSSSENSLPAWASRSQSERSSPMMLVEATGWRTTPSGAILLVADTLKPISVKQLNQLLRSREGKLSPIELLVLSACQTAAGDRRAALGMAGFAVQSGARSTIASLWSVSDLSTASLMIEFYHQLSKPGVTKAEALRRAQVALLHQEDYNSPYYWVPFVLLGNWL